MEFKIGDRVRATPEYLAAPGCILDRGVYTVAHTNESGGSVLVDRPYTDGSFPHTGISAGAFVLAPPIDYPVPCPPPPFPRTAETDPTGRDAHSPGAKLDAGKLQPSLILGDMSRALSAVIKIGTDGALKYTPGGWLAVPGGFKRYEDAQLRHVLKRFGGERHDPDSGSLHLAHEAWNALAKLELYLREQEKVKVS